jgi:hypothetical protein
VALVFLTAPVRYSGDKRLADLGFEVIHMLQHEREIIITKAVSWASAQHGAASQAGCGRLSE